MISKRIEKFISFIKILNEEGIIKRFNINTFEHRLKLQKYMFIAKYLGISDFSEYDFNEYMRGPYSPNLADDYYEIEKKGLNINKEFDLDFYIWLKNSREFKALVGLVKNKDSRWLEVAATMVDFSSTVKRKAEREGFSEEEVREILESILKNRKPFVSRKFISKVYENLKTTGVIAI